MVSSDDARDARNFGRLSWQLHQRYSSRDLYDCLGVRPDASPFDIMHRFREKAKSYHPDSNRRDKPSDSEQRFKDLNAVYEILSDPERRTAYDAWLRTDASHQVQGDAAADFSVPGVTTVTNFPSFRKRFLEDDLDTLVRRFMEGGITAAQLSNGLTGVVAFNTPGAKSVYALLPYRLERDMVEMGLAGHNSLLLVEYYKAIVNKEPVSRADIDKRVKVKS